MKGRSDSLWVLLLGAALFGCALLLVSSQHRARSLFIDLERAQVEARSRDVEWNRLRIELSRAAQPGYVEQSARALGLKPVESGRTVLVSAPAPEAK
ncbi:MAG: cell division protein FtsL [Burkholderiaceae bacterium]